MANPWDRLHLRMWEATSRRLGRVVVQFGAVSTFGMFDRKTEITLDEQVLSLENALTIKTSELGSLAYGDQVTVDGGLYKVRHEPMRMADGLLSIVLLEQAEAAANYLITLSGLRITTLDNRQLRIL
jgi:hypothetical protein